MTDHDVRTAAARGFWQEILSNGHADGERRFVALAWRDFERAVLTDDGVITAWLAYQRAHQRAASRFAELRDAVTEHKLDAEIPDLPQHGPTDLTKAVDKIVKDSLRTASPTDPGWASAAQDAAEQATAQAQTPVAWWVYTGWQDMNPHATPPDHWATFRSQLQPEQRQHLRADGRVLYVLDQRVNNFLIARFITRDRTLLNYIDVTEDDAELVHQLEVENDYRLTEQQTLRALGLLPDPAEHEGYTGSRTVVRR